MQVINNSKAARKLERQPSVGGLLQESANNSVRLGPKWWL
jgi:hypothetical protein